MHRIEIEKQNQIRCPYCLEWNQKESSVCTECTAPILEAAMFGAARATVLWENCDPRKLKIFLSEEKADRISLWNDLFKVQSEYFQSLIEDYRHLASHFILDINDDVEKEFLRLLPMRPELFKDYKDYPLANVKLNETEKIQYIFRAHPVKALKALAAIALIHLGEADENLIAIAQDWKPVSKKLHRERLLSFAHWSVQKSNSYKPYVATISDIMPLYDKEGQASQWARLYLYLGGYNVNELKFEVEELMGKSSLHLSLSCAVALKKSDKIRDLLVNNIDKSTLSLSIANSDERHVPGFIQFLKFAPRKHYDVIVNRLSALKPSSEENKKAIVDWLLSQGDPQHIETIFKWKSIPNIEQIVNKLLNSSEGLAVLKREFHLWLRDFQDFESSESAIKNILNFDETTVSSDDGSVIKKIKEDIRGVLHQALCETVKNKNTEKEVLKLIKNLFDDDGVLTERQIQDGFYSLSKATSAKRANEQLVFSLVSKNICEVAGSEENFTNKSKSIILNKNLNSTFCDWLNGVFTAMSENPSVQYNETSILWIFMMLEMIEKVNKGTDTRFYKFLKSHSHLLNKDEKIKKMLSEILEKNKDHEVQFWVSQLV